MRDLGKELIASMEEAVAHASGEKTGVKLHAPEITPVNVRAARTLIKAE